MIEETVKTDICIIGGGMSGICAAIAAARLGSTVALVQNRPVLGGNSSSEVRVWICGATKHGLNRFARETGIMGELFLENQYRNPDGNPYLWDAVLMDMVRRENNIRLFLNTDVHELEAYGPEEDRRIRSVTGWMMGSERKIRYVAEMFLDCSGDGLIGFLAGAYHRIGRESKSEFGELWAPEIADSITLGSTVLFYTKDAGQPVKYIPPDSAKDISETSIPIRRVIRSGDSGCHYWWIEWGGEFDTVHENERIRDELWSIIYGIWDYIKNSGKFEADNMTLEWVGSLPGKREYRRFIGDYVLNQNDILAQEPFTDRIAFGGWSIDLHPPQGMYAEESGSKHMHADGIYHIPFRSLYSRNVSNLMFAGRNISASHVAFGTTRVMATCAVAGEAAGSGAALCVKEGLDPRTLSQHHMAKLQQVMLRQDASIIGLPSKDHEDLARQARVTASSHCTRLAIEDPIEVYSLHNPVGMLLPVDPGLDSFELLLDAAEDTTLTVELWDPVKKENYVPVQLLSVHSVDIRKGEKTWVTVPAFYFPEQSCNVFVVIRENAKVALYLSDKSVFGLLAFENPVFREEPNSDEDRYSKVVNWRMQRFNRRLFCTRVTLGTKTYSPEKVINGYSRPYGGPNLWVSERMDQDMEQWLELEWTSPNTIREIQLIFNDDVNEDLINLHHHRTPFAIIPELVKDYRLEAWTGDRWQLLHTEKDNRKRRRVHQIANPVETDKLRIVIDSTNGCNRAEVVEVRVYG
jgi:hypothetical protein